MNELASLTSELIAIPSVNPSLDPNGPGEREIAEFVARWLDNAGLRVSIIGADSARPSVVAIAPGYDNGASLLLNAHMDTVGAGGMTDPFFPRLEGDRLFGRGAIDMKASLAAIMLAGQEAARNPRPGPVIVSAVADEEYASIGIQETVGAVRADAAIVTEPTNLDLVIAHKGFAWAEIESRGFASHGSLPAVGADALVPLGPVLTRIGELEAEFATREGHPLLGPGSIHAAVIRGGTELSTYPDRGFLSVERRLIPGETAEQFMLELEPAIAAGQRLAPRSSISARLTLVRDPFAIAADHPFAVLARETLAAVRGEPVALAGAGGWMDSAFLSAAGIPTVVMGPTGEGLHGDREWVDLPSVATLLAALNAMSLAFCQSPLDATIQRDQERADD